MDMINPLKEQADIRIEYSPRKRETLNIRIKPEERGLIDRAAKTRGKNRTDFILDAVRSAAEEALLDQVIIAASPKAYAEFE